mgnify:FL=1
MYSNVEQERERLIGQSIQTWRMFHRHETKAGFWCDICKQCFRKRKAIISVGEETTTSLISSIRMLPFFVLIKHFETSDKHTNNLKHLPPYRRAVQHVKTLLVSILIYDFLSRVYLPVVY